MSFKEQLIDKLDAECKILYIVTEDDKRTAKIIEDYYLEKKEIISYDPATLFYVDQEEQQGEDFASIIIDWIQTGYIENRVLLLWDFHRELDSIRVVSAIRRVIRSYDNVPIIIISNVLNLPKELEHYTTVFYTPYLSEDEIREMIQEHPAHEILSEYDEERIIRYSQGMEGIDIETALNMAFSENGESDKIRKAFRNKKAELLNKTGILSIVDTEEEYDSLGGYSALKKWLRKQKDVLSKEEELFANGMMLVGITGCGKSLCAKASAHELELPLVRMDFGKLVNKYLGESEANLYKALRLVEAMSPCVLWLDEFEKAIGGKDDDNGVSQRLVGILLTWMQEKKARVFIVATVNNISKMPPELLRRGRFDKIYYVDLPSDEERKEILQIHMRKLHIYLPDATTMTEYSQSLINYSGADIEYILKEALRDHIHDPEKTVNECIKASIRRTKSVSQILADEIREMQAEFRNRSFENVNDREKTDWQEPLDESERKKGEGKKRFFGI